MTTWAERSVCTSNVCQETVTISPAMTIANSSSSRCVLSMLVWAGSGAAVGGSAITTTCTATATRHTPTHARIGRFRDGISLNAPHRRDRSVSLP